MGVALKRQKTKKKEQVLKVKAGVSPSPPLVVSLLVVTAGVSPSPPLVVCMNFREWRNLFEPQFLICKEEGWHQSLWDGMRSMSTASGLTLLAVDLVPALFPQLSLFPWRPLSRWGYSFTYSVAMHYWPRAGHWATCWRFKDHWNECFSLISTS